MLRNLNWWYIFIVILCMCLDVRAVRWSSSLKKFSQEGISSENDDDYLFQKESILEKSYHGLIRENETLVEITPLIKVDEEKICSFRILKKPYHEIPFQIKLINNLGILKARRTLNCESRKSYHFEIIAIFCDGTHSEPANVHITVIDINEYAPTFLQPSYVTEVDEGRLYQEIVRVEAIDKDCTPLFGDVCKYEILNNDQPFKIDNEGSIKNTEPLSHTASHNHILSVVAYDCAMKHSVPIMVNIKVRRICEPRILGLPERIDYMTSSEKLLLFPNARLELCDMVCNSQHTHVRASISLKTKHISFGCDREIVNCSGNLPLIDLLPRDAPWTENLNFDEGLEPVFHFDGLTGINIPKSQIAHHDFTVHPFSIVTVFRHSNMLEVSKHSKEHIICSADDHKMNRHHMALFLRNCRLIFLLRKNFNEGDLNVFSPAEWRWVIPQVCDNEWHHYVLNVDEQFKVTLYIDGVRFENSNADQHNNPEIIDDWPLHAAQGINTTLTVGACYQSSENRLRHSFNGDISEIKMSTNGVLSSDDIRCDVNCAEHLITPRTTFNSDLKVQRNVLLNEIYIESRNTKSFDTFLQNVQYKNSKVNPSVGRRNIEIHTTISCSNKTSIRLPDAETYIMVNEPDSVISSANLLTNKNEVKDLPYKRNEVAKENSVATHLHKGITDVDIKLKSGKEKGLKGDEATKLLITGNVNNLISYPEIKKGVHILNNINISAVDGSNLASRDLQYLDSCSVTVFPSLNPDHEEIEIDNDESLSVILNIKTNINKDGLDMIGTDSIENYLDVLKSLVYSNKKPAYYLNRVFKLSCFQINSICKTSEFTLTLTVLHPKQSVPTTTNSPLQILPDSYLYGTASYFEIGVPSTSENKIFAHSLIDSHEAQEPKLRVHSIIRKVENSHPIMLILLISVFLVIIVCGVSVARLKNNNHKLRDSKIADDSLVWDDSALTITINPMQSDGISDDSSNSENSDSEDEESIRGKCSNENQLEWDNSNMFTLGTVATSMGDT